MAWNDIITAENIKVYWEKDTINTPPYLGATFFPSRKQRGLKFEYIKGKDNTPVALVSSNFDTNTLYRDRIGFETLSGTLPFFKESYKIDEVLRQEILSVKDEYRQPLLDNIFDDSSKLITSAEVTAERMRMQLLSTGTIAIAENGVAKNYDFGFTSSKQLKTITTKWDADGAKPLKDLNDSLRAYKTLTKKTPRYVIMSDVVFTYLANDSDVLSYFQHLENPNLYPNDSEVQSFIERKFDITIFITNQVYKKARDFKGADVPFYPEDRFTILSTLDMGETLYGTTPEEADLLGKQSKADSVAIVNTGVAITTWSEVDPVNTNVKASEVVLPTCPNIDLIYITKVLA